MSFYKQCIDFNYAVQHTKHIECTLIRRISLRYSLTHLIYTPTFIVSPTMTKEIKRIITAHSSHHITSLLQIFHAIYSHANNQLNLSICLIVTQTPYIYLIITALQLISRTLNIPLIYESLTNPKPSIAQHR